MAESENSASECRQPPGQTQAADGADTEGEEWEDAASNVGEEDVSDLVPGNDPTGDATCRADVGDDDVPQVGERVPTDAGCKSGDTHHQQPPAHISLRVSNPESPEQLQGNEAPGRAAVAEERAQVERVAAAADDQGLFILISLLSDCSGCERTGGSVMCPLTPYLNLHPYTRSKIPRAPYSLLSSAFAGGR